jgi:hypothetical protein
LRFPLEEEIRNQVLQTRENQSRGINSARETSQKERTCVCRKRQKRDESFGHSKARRAENSLISLLLSQKQPRHVAQSSKLEADRHNDCPLSQSVLGDSQLQALYSFNKATKNLHKLVQNICGSPRLPTQTSLHPR